MSEPLEEVSRWLVTEENPPRDIHGLDYERCAALHNAIFKHGWIKSGRNAGDFEVRSQPWLDLNPERAQDSDLHPSVLQFLRYARALPSDDEVRFFYNVTGLNPSEVGNHGATFPDGDDETLTLYDTCFELASKPDGLVYDQGQHKAIIHFDITDELKPEHPWQKLESILTVWIEMIQRQKVVAISDDIGKERYGSTPDGRPLLIQGPDRDPATGAKRISEGQEPWTIVPYCAQDLDECLELWTMIIQTIESKMGLNGVAQSEQLPLLDNETLNAAGIPDGFARKFLSQARKPRFTYVAPGLRIPLQGTFVTQPFVNLDEDSAPDDQDVHVPPILLFRGDGWINTRELLWLGVQPVDEPTRCPSGLYLNGCDRSYRYPQEDGCSLVLPFKLDGGYAAQSDGSPASQHDSLLQAGKNPFNAMHAVQLQAFLEKVYENVQREGGWSVDADGVAGGIEVWREADTEQGRFHYIVPVEPGCYW